MIKFNSSRGAVVCDKCRVIFVDNFVYQLDEVSKKYADMENKKGQYKHLCEKCEKLVLEDKK